MFGLEYVMALVKICFNVAFAIVGAVPFYYSWNMVAPIYFTFLPELYKKLPYWHIVAFFIICTFLGEQINKLVPKLISISQSNTNNK